MTRTYQHANAIPQQHGTSYSSSTCLCCHHATQRQSCHSTAPSNAASKCSNGATFKNSMTNAWH
eukprot:scaffold316249_cov20-Attheya_sp.AAC.1